VKHLTWCCPSLFQNEATVGESAIKNRYANALKESTKQRIASAKAVTGPLPSPVDWKWHLVEMVASATARTSTFVLWSASKESSG
jgi:hypothetical protein